MLDDVEEDLHCIQIWTWKRKEQDQLAREEVVKEQRLYKVNFVTLTFYYTTPHNLMSLITGNETFTCNDSDYCAMSVYDNVT